MTRSEKIEMLYLKISEMAERLEQVCASRQFNESSRKFIQERILNDDLYDLIKQNKPFGLEWLSESGKLLFIFMDNIKVSDKSPTFHFMEVVLADDALRYDVYWGDICIYSTKSFQSFEVGSSDVDSIANHLGFKIVIKDRRTVLKS